MERIDLGRGWVGRKGRIVVLAAGLVCACAAPSSVSPQAPAEASKTSGTPDGSGSEGTSSSEPIQDPKPAIEKTIDYENAASPTVKVTGVMPSAESADYVRVQLEFTNPNDHPCRIGGYSVFWGDHLKKVEMQDLVLGASQTRERRLKVHPHDGDIDALTVESASAKVLGGCKPDR